MQHWYDVLPTDGGWIVRAERTYLGVFRSQEKAFYAAITEARKARQGGRNVHVRIVRPDGEPQAASA